MFGKSWTYETAPDIAQGLPKTFMNIYQFYKGL